jgi:hypothetical protein
MNSGIVCGLRAKHIVHQLASEGVDDDGRESVTGTSLNQKRI